MRLTRIVAAIAALGLCSLSLAATPEAELAEASGLPLSGQGQAPSPIISPQPIIGGAIPAGGVLLIPESTNDRIMAFDPVTGNLLDADFIPSDPTHLATPINAILSADGQSILVSDQINDVVQEYDLNGNYVGVFAPAGGANVAILDNIRGITLHTNGNLLVTVGGGANADAVAEFDTNGNYLGNFVANGGGGLISPFDVHLIGANYFVGGITSDAIHRYDLNGNAVPNLAAINTFPEQITSAGNGNILVGNFSGTQEGIVEYTPAGAVAGLYNPPGLGGYRGVYELPNNNLLITNGSGVYEIDRAGNLVDTKISGVSARFIEYVAPAAPAVAMPVPAAGLFSLMALAFAVGVAGMRRLGFRRT